MYKKIFRIFPVIIVAVLIATLFSGCGKKPLILDDLFANPASYNNQSITVEAYYFEGSDLNILTSSLIKITSTGDHVPGPGPYSVWLEGSLPGSVESRLYTQTSPTGFKEHYGLLRVTGIFEYGKTYGYLGGYNYQITISEATALNWTPS